MAIGEIYSNYSTKLTESFHNINEIDLKRDYELAYLKISDAKKNRYTSFELVDLAITHLPKEISELNWLEELVLKNNENLFDITALSNLTHLRVLDISNTKVIDLSPLSYLKSLETLNVNLNSNGNLLRRMSIILFKKTYQFINLGLKDISPLKSLIKLKKLSLCGANISDLSPLNNLFELQELDLSLSTISSISSLSSLNKLEKLFLSGTQIFNLDPLKSLNNLISLDIPNTKVIDISPLVNLLNLKEFILFETEVKDISVLSKLVNVEHLGCAATKITELSPIKELNKLVRLDVSYNNLTNIDAISSLIQLERLELVGINLTNLLPISKLKHLKSLWIENNSLSDLSPLKEIILKGIPLFYNNFKNKSYGIFVDNCPIDKVLIAAIEEGQNAVIDYFKSERVQLFESRVLILGEPRAGKTTLRRKLKSVSTAMPNSDESTIAFEIEVEPVSFTFKRNEKQETCTLQIWDFGGQEYYRILHQLFITDQSVYVIVVDTDRNKNEEEIDFWFDTIQRLGGNKNGNFSPVILFQNAKTNRSGSDFIDLKRRYNLFWKQSKEFVVNLNAIDENNLSLFNPTELDKFQEFRQYLEQSFCKLDNFGLEMPKKWIKIKNELTKLKKNWITIEDFFAICEENEIENNEEQERVLSIFRSLGYVLHYEYEKLIGMVILNKEWLIHALYRALDNEIIKKNRGWFKAEDAIKIWSELQYKNRTSELIEVMEKFNLCFYNNVSRKYIVPSLLPENLDDYPELNLAECVRLVLQYDWMPRSVGTQLIVSLNEFIEKRENGEQWIWRNGAILEGIALDYKNIKAKIINNWRENQIEILATGEHSELLIRTILKKWREVNKPFEDKTEVNKIIFCNCNSCITNKRPFIFEYVDVLNAIQRGDSLRCNKSGKNILGEDILKGIFNSKNISKELIKLISEDKIEEAFEKIVKPTNNLILLKGRLNRTEVQFRSSEISDNDRNVERTKISKSFLELMEI